MNRFMTQPLTTRALSMFGLCCLLLAGGCVNGKTVDEIGQHGSDVNCATATDPIACREAVKDAPQRFVFDANKKRINKMRLSSTDTQLYLDAVLYDLSTKTDSEIADELNNLHATPTEIEDFFASLNATQSAQLWTAAPKSRINSILMEMSATQRAVWVWYWGELYGNGLVP